MISCAPRTLPNLRPSVAPACCPAGPRRVLLDTATTAQGALAPRKEATGHTAAAALNAQAATWRPLLPPPQKAQRSALQEGENTGEPTPTRHTLVWPELHYGHQHLSISVTQREQLQVLADRPGSADAAKALLQHRLRVAVQQLPATMKVALERDIPLNAEGGSPPLT